MQAAKDTVAGLGFIILHEADLPDLRIELPLGEGFEEIASMISEDPGLQNHKARNFCLNNIHITSALGVPKQEPYTLSPHAIRPNQE